MSKPSKDEKISNEWLEIASNQIIEHMNDDHSNSIVSALHAQHGIKDTYAKMEKLEVGGYYALSEGKLYFLTFAELCTSVEEYRMELVKHAKKYRKYELNSE